MNPGIKLFIKQWALVPLRLVVGFGFAFHGYAKLARGPERFAAILTSMGIPAPLLAAWSTTLLELVGGVCLMLGAFVTPLSLPLTVIMLTAMFGVHLQYGYSSIRLLSFGENGAQFGPVGYEISLLYIAALLTLAASGSTPWSVDRRLGKS
ncbi:MAG TPA: DoxX family protein [Polyangiaceae bacterium]|nr:DoxX family protein [Polyangiaceae bacterium]